MPLVHIHLKEGQSKEYLNALSQGVQQAMIQTINVPEKDYFHLITEYKSHQFLLDRTYPNLKRSENAVIIHITLSLGRTVEMKRALYQKIAENLHQNPGLRKEDIMIVLVENDPLNWSFGNGIMRMS